MFLSLILFTLCCYKKGPRTLEPKWQDGLLCKSSDFGLDSRFPIGLNYFLGWTLSWARLSAAPLGCSSRLFLSAGIPHRWGDVPASRSDAKVRNNVMVFQIKSLLPFSCADLLFIGFRWWAFYSTFGLSFYPFLLFLHPLVQLPYLNWALL